MIEIKELVVRANINPSPKPANGTKGDEEENCEQATATSSEGANEDVILSCVRQVLAILERQKER